MTSAVELKRDISLSSVMAEFAEVDLAKSDERAGVFWYRCPVHQERTASCKVDDEKGLWKCFGCGAGGDHFTLLQDVGRAADFREAMRWLGRFTGAAERPRERVAATAPPPGREMATRAEARKAARARELWRRAQSDDPMLADYLDARGVDVEALRRVNNGRLPDRLRLDPCLPHHCQRTGRILHEGPAMLGGIGRTGLAGVHRTWITPNGRACGTDGKKLAKQWLGPQGRLFGRPIVLTPLDASEELRMIAGEGIETVLVVLSALAARGELWAAECAMSRDALVGKGKAGTALRRLGGRPPLPSVQPDYNGKGWHPPDEIDRLRLLAEGSSRDPEAARRLTKRGVYRHSFRSDGEPRICDFRLPGGRWDLDLDFADLAVADRAPLHAGSASAEPIKAPDAQNSGGDLITP